MPKKFLDVKNLYKFFNGKNVLENVNFTIDQGQITTLIGQNGSGKTTLAKILVGLEKNYLGKVNRYINKIGYIPQKNNFNINIPIKVSDLISLLSKKNVTKDLEDNKNLFKFTSKEILHDFINIKKILNKDISELSEGELQKILIISILSQDNELFILDEPNQFLDLQSQKLLYKILRDLAINAKASILIISHDLFTVMRHSDQVICLNKHICCSGKIEDIYTDKVLSNALSEIGFYIHKHDHSHIDS